MPHQEAEITVHDAIVARITKWLKKEDHIQEWLPHHRDTVPYALQSLESGSLKLYFGSTAVEQQDFNRSHFSVVEGQPRIALYVSRVGLDWRKFKDQTIAELALDFVDLYEKNAMPRMFGTRLRPVLALQAG